MKRVGKDKEEEYCSSWVGYVMAPALTWTLTATEIDRFAALVLVLAAVVVAVVVTILHSTTMLLLLMMPREVVVDVLVLVPVPVLALVH